MIRANRSVKGCAAALGGMVALLVAPGIGLGVGTAPAPGEGPIGMPPTPPSPDPATITALGQSPVGGDPSAARSLALEDAFHQAVAQAAEALLGSAVYRSAEADLGRRVLPRAHDYVTTYRVLEAGQDSGIYQVKIEAHLDLPRLARDLVTPIEPASQPSGVPVLAVVVDEPPGAGAAATQPVSEVASDPGAQSLVAALAGLGFAARVVPSAPHADLLQQAQQAKASSVVVLVVTGSAPVPIRGTDLVGIVGGVDVSALDVATGKWSGVSHDTVAAYGSSAATALTAFRGAAGATAGRSIGTELSARTGGLPEGVVVSAVGPLRYVDLVGLERTLSSIPGVVSVTPRRFASDSVDLLVDTSISPEGLRDALSRAVMPGALIRVEPSGDSVVRLRVVPQTVVAPEGTTP